MLAVNLEPPARTVLRRAWRATPAIVLGLALIAALLVLLAGPAFRGGVVELGTALSGLRHGAALGVITSLLGLALLVHALWRGTPATRALAGLAVLLGTLAWTGPVHLAQQARAVPPIHDITTDTHDPPRFVRAAERRGAAANPLEYGGAAVARQQRRAYPDIQPLILASDPALAFDLARRAAADMGWRDIDADPDTGRIEAVAVTRWFGFRDDVVIRVRAEDSGSRVDVRSKSRMGRSDLGANAKRIRAYGDRLRQLAAQA